MAEFIQRYKNLPQNLPQNPPQGIAMMLIKWQLIFLLESRPHRKSEQKATQRVALAF